MPVGGETWTSGPDSFKLRPLPSEDVYFFIKKIDNSRVAKQADPAASRRAWQAGVKGVAVAALLIMLLMPRALEMMAGYRIHALAAEHDRLVNQKATLALEEAQLESPARLQQLAGQLRLVNPDPQHVVMLNSAKTDSALAMNVTR
jgi:cell division protein FtsL